ncbi:calsenilin-like isoform X1 [Artemia franciscana]|uniref:calsenilin-like isoform X1 n=1 Tax=Artemia franciscana TaxID=6661 RepID=UPI0032DB6BDF
MASYPTDAELDEIAFRVQIRYQPEELEKLEKKTNFSRQEIQIIYRGFKQGCPAGTIDEDSFVNIFTQFFPLGDASQYAHFVFKTIRRSKSGEINFEEFLCCLSNISRGTLEEKIRWVFNLYDLNNDGLISRTEMLAIISSVYEMIGPSIEPPAGEETISDHVDRIFDVSITDAIDTNKDGAITYNDFINFISNDTRKMESFEVLDTLL